MVDIVERLLILLSAIEKTDEMKGAIETVEDAADEIERLREVVMLLVAYDEHDEEIQKGAVMWDVLIEAAHAALKEKE